MEAFLPAAHWEQSGAEALVLGAGGSSIAVTCYMMDERHGANRPGRIYVTNRSEPRLEEIQRIHEKIGRPVPCEYVHCPEPTDNDAVLGSLKARSLVMNSTGLGKDAPGSPITERGLFPEGGYAWDFNYRGDLLFLDQASAQADSRRLHVEDGWVYFIHGWTRVIAEVFHIDIPTRGPQFDELSRVAAETRQ
jgi:shikimate 5-dehydrogenase